MSQPSLSSGSDEEWNLEDKWALRAVAPRGDNPAGRGRKCFPGSGGIHFCQDRGKMENIQGMGISVLIYHVYSRYSFSQCLWLLIFLHLIFCYHIFYDISRDLLNQKCVLRIPETRWSGWGCLERVSVLSCPLAAEGGVDAPALLIW